MRGATSKKEENKKEWAMSNDRFFSQQCEFVIPYNKKENQQIDNYSLL
jgi:hypothetical protein